MRKRITIAGFIALYSSGFIFFLLLFLEESPFRENPTILKLSQVFSIGWDFFTKDPRSDKSAIFYYKNNQWIPLSRSNSFLTREIDAVQTEIYYYSSSVSDSVWDYHKSEQECFNTVLSHPPLKYQLTNDSSVHFHTKKFIIENYSNYYLIMLSTKMPWAWLRNYSQTKMKCKSVLVKI